MRLDSVAPLVPGMNVGCADDTDDRNTRILAERVSYHTVTQTRVTPIT